MSLIDIIKQDSPISQNLNIEFVSAENGNSKIKMLIDKNVLNPYKIVHGGAIFTLADTAAGAAAISFNSAYVTMDSYMNFMQPGVGKELIANAKTSYKGDETCVVDVSITNDEEVLIAKGMFTMFKVDIKDF